MPQVITRFAPSPTGFLHIGGVRSALFNYLFARKNGGKFFLRIEDTDKKRNKKEYEEDIIESFKIVGIDWDNNPIYRQSEQTKVYKKLIENLIKEGKAFVSKETPKEEGDRDEVIRLKNPNKEVKFNDFVHGDIKVDTTDLGDFVIAKSLEEPIFHFANVVDDHAMKITHVIRGEEHLPNTPRQILIQEALGYEKPFYAHIPLVLASDRSKLSKREGSVSLRDFLEKGYLPEALINYLALLGWHPVDNKEIFTMEELVRVFDLARVQKGGAIWNTEKLDWVNKEHLKKMNRESRIENYEKELKKAGVEISNKEILEKIEPIITERINKFGDIKEMADRREVQFFFSRPNWKKEEFLWKGEGSFADVARRLKETADLISKIDGDFNKEVVKSAIWSYAEKEGRGLVLWPARYGLSGLQKSPDPFIIAEILGKEETVARLKTAADFLLN